MHFFDDTVMSVIFSYRWMPLCRAKPPEPRSQRETGVQPLAGIVLHQRHTCTFIIAFLVNHRTVTDDRKCKLVRQ